MSALRERATGFVIRETEARSILSPTTGYIAEAGFTHSLTPARNCTFGCTYCYVPTLGIYGGLKPEDWQRWGQFTTFKKNAAELVRRAVRPEQTIYCSPLVDPYQPAEAEERLMPGILEALIEAPPRVFVVQTRGTLVLRDLELLQRLRARVSFSVTTNRDEVRRLYEPLCAPIAERIETIDALRREGIEVYATLAPLLPCDPEGLVDLVLAHTETPVICDPLHIRATKARGATTRDAAVRISRKHGFKEWHEAGFQAGVVERMRVRAGERGRGFGVGPVGFGWLAG